jgi:hypothetical protein
MALVPFVAVPARPPADAIPAPIRHDLGCSGLAQAAGYPSNILVIIHILALAKFLITKTDVRP